VNHSVHLCIKGCFTLKFSGSWNTVICSSSPRSAFSSGELPPSGEIGMVERSTGEAGLPLWVVASIVVAAMAGTWVDVMYLERENQVEKNARDEVIDHTEESECVDSVNRGSRRSAPGKDLRCESKISSIVVRGRLSTSYDSVGLSLKRVAWRGQNGNESSALVGSAYIRCYSTSGLFLEVNIYGTARSYKEKVWVSSEADMKPP
jgi:hypothetical protein